MPAGSPVPRRDRQKRLASVETLLVLKLSASLNRAPSTSLSGVPCAAGQTTDTWATAISIQSLRICFARDPCSARSGVNTPWLGRQCRKQVKGSNLLILMAMQQVPAALDPLRLYRHFFRIATYLPRFLPRLDKGLDSRPALIYACTENVRQTLAAGGRRGHRRTSRSYLV